MIPVQQEYELLELIQEETKRVMQFSPDSSSHTDVRHTHSYNGYCSCQSAVLLFWAWVIHKSKIYIPSGVR